MTEVLWRREARQTRSAKNLTPEREKYFSLWKPLPRETGHGALNPREEAIRGEGIQKKKTTAAGKKIKNHNQIN